MRLLLLADEPPDFPLERALEGGLDAVICLGDLTSTTLIKACQLEVPVMGVRGNHDIAGVFEELGIIDLHLERLELGGLVFGGLEGSPKYKDDDFHYTEQEFEDMLYSYDRVDVMCCHSPPRGVNDHPTHPPHHGSQALRSWVLRHEPRLLLHGHTYPDPDNLQLELGATKIRYVKGGAILSLAT